MNEHAAVVVRRGELADIERPVLETPRLVLSEPTAADADDIVDGANDFEVSRWLARVPYPYGPSDAAFFLKEVVSVSMSFAIRRRDDGAFLGTIGLTPSNGDLVLGYWLSRPHWGAGYATEAGRAILQLAFDTLGRERVLAGVLEGNHRSAHVLEKLGFRVTGVSMLESLALGRAVPHIDMVCERPADPARG